MTKKSNAAMNALARTVPVLPYQERWVKDNAQLKVAVWSRQSGKSFAAALRAVLKCIDRRTQYIVLSKGERQSRLFMEKVKDFCEVFKAAKVLPEYAEIMPTSEEKAMEVFFPHNHSRIIGLPANPDTARGYSANVVLDEFAIHTDSREIWGALYGCITRGYRIIVLSTPKGKSNKFYELWEHGGDTWSHHHVDIYEAIAQGLVLKNPEGGIATPEQLKEGLGDSELWAQEYELEFVDEATAYLGYDLINTCEDDLAGMSWSDDTRTSTSLLYMGFDVARKRDLSIIWTAELVGDVLWSREVLRMEKTKFSVQRSELYARLAVPRVRRCCIDCTGIGAQLAEEARDKFGSRVEEVTFTAPVKEDLATTLRGAFEDRLIRIPSDREVREDLHAVQKLTTTAGNTRYDAERTEQRKGHADHFWAAALSVHAHKGGGVAGPVEYKSVAKRTFQKGAW